MGCKVDSLIERHALTVPESGYETVDEYLVARWTGSDGQSSVGYKTLTKWFNKRLLKRLYEKHDRGAGIHLDREYEIISGDDELQRSELAADLATDGLAIDDIDCEMVSWSTMRHHLKDCLTAEKDTTSADTDWETNTVRIARERAADKARSALSSLSSKGRLRDADRATVDVQVKLSCPNCSLRVPFTDAVERGYVCETHSETESRESVIERVRNRSTGIAFPYVITDAVQSTLIGDSLLIEAATVAAF